MVEEVEFMDGVERRSNFGCWKVSRYRKKVMTQTLNEVLHKYVSFEHIYST